jgi:hypothetical protein
MHDEGWSTPLATLTAETDDCKDYAILKYVALREAGSLRTMLDSPFYATSPSARIMPWLLFVSMAPGPS